MQRGVDNRSGAKENSVCKKRNIRELGKHEIQDTT